MAGNIYQHAGGLHLPPAIQATPGRTTPPTSAALTKLGTVRFDAAELLHIFAGQSGQRVVYPILRPNVAFTSIMNTYTKTNQEIHTHKQTQPMKTKWVDLNVCCGINDQKSKKNTSERVPTNIPASIMITPNPRYNAPQLPGPYSWERPYFPPPVTAPDKSGAIIKICNERQQQKQNNRRHPRTRKGENANSKNATGKKTESRALQENPGPKPILGQRRTFLLQIICTLQGQV